MLFVGLGAGRYALEVFALILSVSVLARRAIQGRGGWGARGG